MSLGDWINVVLAALTFGGLVLAYRGLKETTRFNNQQLELLNEQLKLNFFADYTKRYQEIVLQLPAWIYDKDFDTSKLDETTKAQITKYVRVYFDLCSEEYHLYLNHKIDDAIWKNWEEGMKHALSLPVIQLEWKKVNNTMAVYYPEFSSFMEELSKEEGTRRVVEPT